RHLAAGGARARAAGAGAERAEPARVVRLRAGLPPGAVCARAVLADQLGLVRVGRAGRGRRGFLRAAGGRRASAAAPAVRAARQGSVRRARDLPQQLRATQVTENHVDATLKLAAQVKAGQRPAPDLVIWPENATALAPFQNPSVYAQLSTAVAAIGKPILVGEVLNDPRRNVGQLWAPGRGPTTACGK